MGQDPCWPLGCRVCAVSLSSPGTAPRGFPLSGAQIEGVHKPRRAHGKDGAGGDGTAGLLDGCFPGTPHPEGQPVRVDGGLQGLGPRPLFDTLWPREGGLHEEPCTESQARKGAQIPGGLAKPLG